MKDLGKILGLGLASGILVSGIGLLAGKHIGESLYQPAKTCIEQPMISYVKDMDLDGTLDVVVVPNPAFEENADFSPKPLVFYGSRTSSKSVSYSVECSCPEYEQ